MVSHWPDTTIIKPSNDKSLKKNSIKKDSPFIPPFIEFYFIFGTIPPPFYLIRTWSAQNLTPLISPHCPYIYGNQSAQILSPLNSQISWIQFFISPNQVDFLSMFGCFALLNSFGFYAPKKIPIVHTFFLKEWISVICFLHLEVMELEALWEQV